MNVELDSDTKVRAAAMQVLGYLIAAHKAGASIGPKEADSLAAILRDGFSTATIDVQE